MKMYLAFAAFGVAFMAAANLFFIAEGATLATVLAVASVVATFVAFLGAALHLDANIIATSLLSFYAAAATFFAVNGIDFGDSRRKKLWSNTYWVFVAIFYATMATSSYFLFA